MTPHLWRITCSRANDDCRAETRAALPMRNTCLGERSGPVPSRQGRAFDAVPRLAGGTATKEKSGPKPALSVTFRSDQNENFTPTSAKVSSSMPSLF